MKTVYIAMSADLITPNHVSIIQEASRLGDVVIGLLIDSAVAGYQRQPADFTVNKTIDDCHAA